MSFSRICAYGLFSGLIAVTGCVGDELALEGSSDGLGADSIAGSTHALRSNGEACWSVESRPMLTFDPTQVIRELDLSDCAALDTARCGAPLDIDQVGRIVSVSSDEQDSYWPGDPGNDIEIIGKTRFRVRAERNPYSNGRVYSVDYVVSDAEGNYSELETCHVGIRPIWGCGHIPPHDDGADHHVDAPQPGLFLRGTMTDWQALDAGQFSPVSHRTYELTAHLDAGIHEFKIADAQFAYHDLGSGAAIHPDGSENLFASFPGPIGNSTLEIAEAGQYKFILDFADDVASTLKVVQLPSAALYLRGSFNDWQALEGFQFQPARGSTYEIIADIAAGLHEFKVADESFLIYDLGTYPNDTLATDGDSIALETWPGTNSNAYLDITRSGTYKFILDLASPGISLTAVPLPRADLYLRGSFNNWEARDDGRLRPVDGSLYAVMTYLEQGTHVFKLGDATWLEHDLGAGVDLEINALGTAISQLPGPDGDTTVTVTTAGTYLVVLDMADRDVGGPSVRIETAPDLDLYLRGSINDWTAPHDARLEYAGNATYRLVSHFDAGVHEIKIGDAEWARYDWGTAGYLVANGEAESLALLRNAPGNTVVYTPVSGDYEILVDFGDPIDPQLSIHSLCY